MVANISDVSTLVVDIAGLSIVTPYIAVYGTLRPGKINHEALLEGHSTHIGTYVLPGWTLQGLSGYRTGETTDGVVVDLIQLTGTDLDIHETNTLLDELEGVGKFSNHGSTPYNYTTVLLRLHHPTQKNKVIYAKIYEATPHTVEYRPGIIDITKTITGFTQLPKLVLASTSTSTSTPL